MDPPYLPDYMVSRATRQQPPIIAEKITNRMKLSRIQKLAHRILTIFSLSSFYPSPNSLSVKARVPSIT